MNTGKTNENRIDGKIAQFVGEHINARTTTTSPITKCVYCNVEKGKLRQ